MSSKQLQHMKIALEYYLQRGELALIEFEKDDLDKASELLVWRQAAFCNFKYVQSSAESALFEDSDLRNIYQKVVVVNSSLHKVMDKKLRALRFGLEAANKTKEKIGRFHSGIRKIESIRSII